MFGQHLAAAPSPQLEQPLTARAHRTVVAANGFVVSLRGALQTRADILEMLREGRHAAEQFFSLLGNLLRVRRLLVQLPTQQHRAQQRDERGRRCEQDVPLGRPDNEVAVAFERRAEERLGRQEEDDIVERVRELRRITALGQRLDGAAQFLRVCRERLGALRLIRRAQRAEEVEVRHLRVHDDDALTRQADDHVGLLVIGLRLLGEIAMHAHAGGLDHASQRLLAPLAARLVRAEDAP